MKKIKIGIAIRLITIAIIMVACKNNLVESSENGSNSTTPYASETELKELSENGFLL